MHRSTLRSFGLILAGAIVSFSPHAASAQPAPAGDFTTEQVRSQYVDAGFQVDAPTTWWTSNSVTTFRVLDPTSGRVVMVLVYPDSAVARAERARVQAQENSGAHLVPGYGLSTWRQNVALVESNIQELGRLYAVEQARDNEIMLGAPSTGSPAPAQPTSAVDLDFIMVVDGGTANL